MKQSQVAISSNVINFHSDTGEPCLCLLGPWRALAGPGFGMLRPADTRKNASVYTGWPKKTVPWVDSRLPTKKSVIQQTRKQGTYRQGRDASRSPLFPSGWSIQGGPKNCPLGTNQKFSYTHCH